MSNEHGEQHHFSFQGLPSPGAGATVAAFVLFQRALQARGAASPFCEGFALVALWVMPVIVLATGLLMVTSIRYPHVVNRYLRGRQPLWRLILMLGIVLFVLVATGYALAMGTAIYAAWGPVATIYAKFKPKPLAQPNPPALPPE